MNRPDLAKQIAALPPRSHERLRLEGKLSQIMHDELASEFPASSFRSIGEIANQDILPRLEGSGFVQSRVSKRDSDLPIFLVIGAIVVLNVGAVIGGLLAGWWF